MLKTSTPQKTLALSAAAALMLTACGGETGIGDSQALSDLDVNHGEEGEAPEVVLYEDIEAEENSARVINEGDGDQITEDSLLEYHLTVVDPETGENQQSTYEQPLPPILPLSALAESEAEVDQFIWEGLSADGVTVGSDVAFYVVPDEEQGITDSLLYVFEVLEQHPSYATGEEEEQSGDLPEIDSETGERPELTDHDTEAEAPEELSSEVLISGDGPEIGEGDQVYAQYRGWRWEDGEEFDSSWTEDGAAGEPFGFSTTGGVIDGWLEGIPGHQVGDRLLLVIPPEQAYGETDDEEEGLTAEGSPGGALIFVIDLVHAIDAETVSEIEAQQQQQQAPGLELSEEERERLEELADESGMSVEELEMLGQQLGIGSVEELEMLLEAPGSEDEADDADAEDQDDTDEEEGE